MDSVLPIFHYHDYFLEVNEGETLSSLRPFETALAEMAPK